MDESPNPVVLLYPVFDCTVITFRIDQRLPTLTFYYSEANYLTTGQYIVLGSAIKLKRLACEISQPFG
jgi:hypothetical protein